jgi:hypothetical protein
MSEKLQQTLATLTATPQALTSHDKPHINENAQLQLAANHRAWHDLHGHTSRA